MEFIPSGRRYRFCDYFVAHDAFAKGGETDAKEYTKRGLKPEACTNCSKRKDVVARFYHNDSYRGYCDMEQFCSQCDTLFERLPNARELGRRYVRLDDKGAFTRAQNQGLDPRKYYSGALHKKPALQNE